MCTSKMKGLIAHTKGQVSALGFWIPSQVNSGVFFLF